MTHIPGQWSPQWAKADERYWRRMALNNGECPDCGERLPSHEDGCRNAPSNEPEESDEE